MSFILAEQKCLQNKGNTHPVEEQCSLSQLVPSVLTSKTSFLFFFGTYFSASSFAFFWKNSVFGIF